MIYLLKSSQTFFRGFAILLLYKKLNTLLVFSHAANTGSRSPNRSYGSMSCWSDRLSLLSHPNSLQEIVIWYALWHWELTTTSESESCQARSHRICRDFSVDQGYGHDTQALWHDLQNLAPAVRTMANLTTFSLTMTDSLAVTNDHEMFDIFDFCIRVKNLTKLMSSLPPSCVNLKLDTCGFDQHATEPCEQNSFAVPQHHLCVTIADLLPRLQHVPLWLRMACDSIFLENHAPSPQTGICNIDKIRYVSSSRLRTLVIGSYKASGPYLCPSSMEFSRQPACIRFDQASQVVTIAAKAAH